MTAALRATGNMSASMNGEADMIANANLAANGYATMTGEADMAAGLTAIGNMSAKFDPFARPTAFDIAAEIWGASRSGFPPGTTGKALDDAEKAAKLSAVLSA